MNGMSWETKTDFCGLAEDGKLICKGSNENKSMQTLEKNGRLGQIAAAKYFATVAAPSCEYTIAAKVTKTGVKLGAITSVDGKKFALQSISIKTTAGSEPTFSGTSQQVEDGADASKCNYFTVPEFSIDPDEIAQELFSAFTLTGSDCELTDCGAEISCTVNTSKVNGYPFASDVVGGKIVVSLTVGQYGETAPTVVPADGWQISAPMTSSDPDSDMPTWTCSLTKPLVKTKVA